MTENCSVNAILSLFVEAPDEFMIEMTTGEIKTTNQSLDRETKSSYTFQVVAVDIDGRKVSGRAFRLSQRFVTIFTTLTKTLLIENKKSFFVTYKMYYDLHKLFRFIPLSNLRDSFST